jgi:hypothetical protein
MYFDFLDPFFHLKPVPPLFLYFLFFVSVVGEVGVQLPLLELGVEPLLSEVGVALLSLVVGIVLPLLPSLLLSLFESLPPWRRRRQDKVSHTLASMIPSKVDKIKEAEDHLSMHARRSQVA